MQEYYVIEFTGIENHPDYSCYAYQSGDGLTDGASALTSKRWKTAAGAEKALLKMKRDSSYLFEKYKHVQVTTIDDSDIESAQAGNEQRKFEQELNYLRRRAETYERNIKAKMDLRRAEALVDLKEGDAVLYYPDGFLGDRKVQLVESVGISSLQVAGKPFDRIHGKCREDSSYVLPNLEELHEYFEPYQRIHEFAQTNWNNVPADVLLKFSDALSTVERLVNIKK